jgi:uncharacterized protein (DUF1810 family)
MNHDLSRFIAAQQATYATALAELRSGRKRSHWMWFVFPQLRDLGRSETAKVYGLAGLAEAEAYLKHPVLGPRLEECTQAVLASRADILRDLFGYPDDLKFVSSMTIFNAVTGASGVFLRALETFNGGKQDPMTLALLAKQ